MGNVCDSGYTFRRMYTYSGRSGRHAIYELYPDDSRMGSHQHGQYAKDKIANWHLRDYGAPKSFSKTFVSKFTGKTYVVTGTQPIRSLSGNWECNEMPSGKLANIEHSPEATPNTITTITVDINNIGGNGKFNVKVYDGSVLLAQGDDITVDREMTIRRSYDIQMLDRDMTLAIKLYNARDDSLSDEKTVTIKKLVPPPPEPEPEDEPSDEPSDEPVTILPVEPEYDYTIPEPEQPDDMMSQLSDQLGLKPSYILIGAIILSLMFFMMRR